MLKLYSKACAVALLFLSLYSSSSYGQAVGDFRSLTSGNWNATTTWQQCFTASVWAAASTTPTSANGTITILSGHTVTVTANVTVDNVITSGTIDVSAGQTLTVANGAGTDITVNATGVILNSGTISINASAVVSSCALTNNSTGNIIVNGALNTVVSTITSNSGAITINATGTLGNVGSITNTASGIITNSGAITNTGSIINNGTLNNNLTFTNSSAGTFINNLTLNNATTGTITQNSSTQVTNGTAGIFTNYGTFTLTSPRNCLCNGTIINTGTINSGPISYGTLTFSATGLYQHNFNSAAAPTGVIPTATWQTGSVCEILACGNSGNGPTTGLGQSFSDFIWNDAAQALDINLNALLGSSRDMTIKNTNGKNLILRHTSSGLNTAVSRDLIILTGGQLIFTDGDPAFGSSGHTASVGRNYIQSGGSCTLTTSVGTGSTAGTGSGTMTVTGNLNLSGGTLLLNASAAVSSVCTATATVTGSCTISGGTLNLSTSTTTGGGGSGILNVAGDFTHTAGAVSRTGTTAGIININGAAAQSIESIGFTSGNTIAFNVTQTTATGVCNLLSGKTFVMNTGTTFTLNDNASASPDYNITGTFITNGPTWLFTGQASLTGTFINNSTGVVQSNSTASTLNCTSGSVFRMGGDGGQVATATWNAASTLEVTGIVANDSIGNCNQLFGIILWNSSSQNSSATFKGVYTIPVFGTQGDFIVLNTGAGTGKVRFPDLNFTIGDELQVINAGKLQVANTTGLYATAYRTVTINGNVTLGASATITVGTPNTTATAAFAANKARTYVFALKKDFIHGGGTLITLDHKSYNGANNDEEYRLVLNFSGGITQTLQMGDIGTYAMTYTSGNGIANDATADEFVSAYYPYKITVTGANTRLAPSSFLAYHNMTVGAASASDTLDLAAGALVNAIHFATIDSLGIKKYASTTVTANAVMDMGTAAITQAVSSDSSTVFLNSLAEIKTQHADGISSTAATGCLQVTGSRVLNPNANYTYDGTAAQNTGNALPATLTGVLEIDNSTALTTGGVTLTQLTSITGASGTRRLSLLDGRLNTTAAAYINIGNGSAVLPTGGSAVSFVDGPVRKTGNAAFIFPTGDVQGAVAKWARIGITAPGAATDAYTAQYNYTNPHVISTAYGAGVSDISYKEYWPLTRNAGGSAPQVTLYWEDGSLTGVGSGITSTAFADLHVAEFYSALWNDKGAAGTSGSAALGTVTIATATFTTGTAMPFTFQSPSGLNPLPIELMTFTGSPVDSGNQLTWTTATETNNDYFELQHCTDAQHFTAMAIVDGNGNTTSTINYEKLDAAPANAINYYRLKQVDFNGDFTYSSIVAIDNRNTSDTEFVLVYPNPATEETINISLSDNINELTVYNALGEVVYKQNNLPAGNKLINLAVFSKGMYVIKAVTVDQKVVTSKFAKN